MAPRPIGWIGSLSADGIANLAPFSFYNAVSEKPHYVAIGIDHRADTLANVKATGVFSVNMATWDLRTEMNTSSASVEPHVDEFDLARLPKAPCPDLGAAGGSQSGLPRMYLLHGASASRRAGRGAL